MDLRGGDKKVRHEGWKTVLPPFDGKLVCHHLTDLDASTLEILVSYISVGQNGCVQLDVKLHWLAIFKVATP